MDSYDAHGGRSPKRFKQWMEPDVQGLLSDDATLPVSMPPTYPFPNDDIEDILSSSPPATIPTQIVGTPSRNLPSTIPTQIIGTPTRNIIPSIIQVAASSPVIKESPRQPRSVPTSINVSATPTPPARRSYIIKIDLDDDMEVPYAGSSSDDEDDKTNKSMITNSSATTFYQSRPKLSPSDKPSSNIFRIPESPVARPGPVSSMRSYAGQFTYNADKRPNWTAAADVARMKANRSMAQKRPLPPQHGPAVPRPNGVIDLSEVNSLVEDLKKEFPEQPMQKVIKAVRDSNHVYTRAKLALQKQQLSDWGYDPLTLIPRVKRVFPNIDMYIIVEALIKNGGAYDDTIAFIAEEQSNRNVIVIEDDVETSAKAKRNTQRVPTKTIRDKYSHLNQSPVKPTLPPPSSSESSSVVPKPRKRLIQGKNVKRVESSEEPETVDLVTSEEEDNHVPEVQSAPSGTEIEILAFINSTDVAGLVDLSFTDDSSAEIILSHRPYTDLSEIREVVDPKVMKGRGKTARPKNIGDRIVDQCLETWEGFETVDALLKECQKHGDKIKEGMKGWQVKGAEEPTEGLDIVAPGESGTSPTPSHSGLSQGMQSLMHSQPKLMAEDIQLKPYQVIGVQWLKLLHDQSLGCILADEMGLGKTCQVIGFLALLLEKSINGPHLVVVPPSTLENWLREFQRFSPSLKVEPYYGSLAERKQIRQVLEDNPDFHVIITTYNTFQGTSNNSKIDMHFLRQFNYNVAIFDEGHQLKNNSSDRAVNLSRLRVRSRILLTGTPLQNNLQELMNLLSFILPSIFVDKHEHLAAIFKYKAKTSDNVSAASKLLSHERIKRAKAMMTPFVLRRRKLQVLHDLPKKFQHIIEVDLTPVQANHYKKTVESAVATVSTEDGQKKAESKVSLLMKLRQAAIHPLLSRRIYTDDMLYEMAKALKKEEYYRPAEFQVDLMKEDFTPMTDYELDVWCRQSYPNTLGKFKLKNQEWMDSAKVLALKDILLDAKKNGDRVLVFSQFTQVLDILERVLGTIDIPFLRLDGSTNVALRQELIDQFEEEVDITAFLLSTKAGGVGLNLAAANRVVIFDASFNPFDDLQAEDRAWRIGQTRDVHVTRLISKGTIEENIDQLARTKLMLDASVSGNDDAAEAGEKIANFVRSSLVKQIFNAEE
ncbi:hypothetical protein ABW20_dc0107536 [Dactylellina cionopaga]|nr:hypothetical protein ABW20_dc0107536 [Dactylellina cionopaga]